MEEPTGLYRIVKQKRLYEEVVRQITDLVVRKRLLPGDKLPPERDLAEELGVSRTAIREAVKALEQMRVLEARQGSGTFVRDVSLDALSESFSLVLQRDIARHFELQEIRGILDVEIAGRLAERASAEDLACMRDRVGRMRERLDSPREFALEDVAFHMAMYEAMRNDMLIRIMQPIMSLLGDAMQLTVEAPGSAESSLAGHEELVRRIEARDSEGARSQMQRIIQRGEQRLKQALPKSPAEAIV